MNNAVSIGDNIRTARKEKRMTQRQLAEATDVSQTQLSDYENGKKIPGLHTLAKISQSLGKAIDELFYGDESVSFISSAPDEGRLVANCIYQLWKRNVITEHVVSGDEPAYLREYFQRPVADLWRYADAVQRLLKTLGEFSSTQNTYGNPDLYLEQVLDSVASEINSEYRITCRLR